MDKVSRPASPEIGKNTITQEQDQARQKAEIKANDAFSERIANAAEKVSASDSPHLEFDSKQAAKLPHGNIGHN